MKAINCCLDKLTLFFFLIFENLDHIQRCFCSRVIYIFCYETHSPDFFSMIMEVVVVEAEPAQPPPGKYILDIRWIWSIYQKMSIWLKICVPGRQEW